MPTWNSSTHPSWYCDASELADLIRKKLASPREIIEVLLERIRLLNPKINAMVTVMAEQAMQRAIEAERSVASGEALGPLRRSLHDKGHV